MSKKIDLPPLITLTPARARRALNYTFFICSAQLALVYYYDPAWFVMSIVLLALGVLLGWLGHMYEVGRRKKMK